MALARDLVIGPLGGLVGLGGETTVGWATSSPPLAKESSSTLNLHFLHDMARDRPH